MIEKIRLLGPLLMMLICYNSCGQEKVEVWKVGIDVSEDTISYGPVFGEPAQGVLVVKEDVDLMNLKCCLPKSVTLSFQGGVIKNGTLVGNETKIDCHGACFERVRILGTWDVPEISTSMFKDLDYDNSLKDVVALASPKVKNRIVIEKGNYQVSAANNRDVCIPVCGNTELIIEGTIRLVPNDFENYEIIQVKGNEVEIKGGGTIIGDKHNHTGETGEWGMGIDLKRARNVSISGLTIKDCWGDCIYVGGKSTNVIIENCLLDNGRRQGVSITSADDVTIRECKITNVEGTAPEYAIDVEPNKGNVVDHVTIDRVTVRDCKGGFLVLGNAKDARVGNVSISRCDVSADRKIALKIYKCDTVIIENCKIKQGVGSRVLVCKNVGYVSLKDNKITYNKVMSKIEGLVRKAVGRKEAKVIDLSNCGSTVVEGKGIQ